MVTVTSSAQPGTVTIEAEYEAFEAEAALMLTSSEDVSDELTFVTTAGAVYKVNVTAKNMAGFDGRFFSLTYDPAVLEIVDLCALTGSQTLTVGPVPRTGLTIESVSSGEIVFSFDKAVPGGKLWSGTINIFKFRALGSQSATISIE